MRPQEHSCYIRRNTHWIATDAVDVTHLPDGQRIRLNRAHAYRDSQGRWHEAPAGFVCDGASVPRLIWTLAGHPFGVFFFDAIIHDWMYEQIRVEADSRRDRRQMRRRADWVFRDSMRWRVRNVLDGRWRYRLKARTYYIAVRLAGWATV